MFWEAAQRAFRKVRSSLGPDALSYIERFGTVFHHALVGASDYSKKAELIDNLMQAAEERRVVNIVYQSLQATEPTTYDVYPVGVVYFRGSLYLVGWAPRREEIRHWKVDRIEDLELTDFRFNPLEGFDLKQHLSSFFGIFHGDENVHVTIHFSATVARYVREGNWHPSQKLSLQKDGRLIAEFDLTSTEEIKRWIMGFGRHATVLEPESLAIEIRDEAIEMSGAYASTCRKSDRRVSS